MNPINLSERILQLKQKLNSCTLCPHECKVNRLDNIKGKCRSTNDVAVSSYNVHYGEEPPISGYNGSGTIFLTNCNLSCVFCQNYPISQLGNGSKVSIDELSKIMLELQSKKVHNINFVTPTHFVPQIVEAVYKARENGLIVPLVYNCGGYENPETLRLLEGIIDIYMPDIKYTDSSNSGTYSGVPDYWEKNKAALKEMYRQVGDLSFNGDIANKGLLIRHLVLPNNISGSKEALEFIAKEISQNTYISIMAQYHPAHESSKHTQLSRAITKQEYKRVLKIAEQLGLENIWAQEL